MTGRYLCIAATLPLALGLGACKEDTKFADAGVEADASGADARTDLPSVEFPTDLAIGLVNCGGSQTFTFDVENTGGGDLDYDITSTNAAVFSVSPASGTLVADTVTTFTLIATMPQGATPGAEVTGDLQISSDALAADHIVNLHAAPRGGVLTLTPSAAAFGDVVFGTSAEQGVIVENHGNAPVDVAIGDASDPEFAVAFVDGRVLANGASRVAHVTYTPDGLGGDSATAAITVTGATCGASPTSVTMSANGVPDGVLVNGNLAFGTQLCGAAGNTSNLSIFNDGPIPATWTATFLSDAQGDEGRYQLSATSGTVAAGATSTLVVTRLAIALPATPRAYDAVLRVVTTGETVVSRDIPVTQLLSGPVLSIDIEEGKGGPYVDFGWGPTDETLSRTIVVSNSGNALANDATFTLDGDSSDAFDVPTGSASIAGGATASFSAAYRALVEGEEVSGDVAISAPNHCGTTIAIDLQAGYGPWLEVDTLEEAEYCGRPVPFGGGPTHAFSNRGNGELVVEACAEVTAGPLAPDFLLPQTVGAASSLGIGYAFESQLPSASGTTTTTVRCATNERFHQTRDFTFELTVFGADLVVTQPDGVFTFDCADTPAFRRLSIRNAGNYESGTLYGSGSAPFSTYITAPLSGFSVGSGVTDVTSVGVGIGPGDTCYQGSGSIAIVPYFDGNNVCTIDVDTHEITLTGDVEPDPQPNPVRGTQRDGATPVRQPTRR